MKTLWKILLAAIILLAAAWLWLFATNRSLADKISGTEPAPAAAEGTGDRTALPGAWTLRL